MRIQWRRGTSAFWESENPTLFPGEPGYERDTKKWKLGDGVTPWRDLPYQGSYVPTDDDGEPITDEQLLSHIDDLTPHPVYDDGPSLTLLYENAKV